MIKKVWIDGFKSLDDFEIDLKPFSVIIGNNAVGKSTVLQALDFLANCVREDFNIIIERRGQRVQNIKSKLKNTSKLQFRTQVELMIQGEKRLLEWELQINIQSQKNMLSLYKEQITGLDNGKVYLEWNSEENGFIKDRDNVGTVLSLGFTYKSSMMNLIKLDKNKYPELYALKAFCQGMLSFDMLTPEKMRLSSRGVVNTIGKEGDKLPSFIKSLDDKQKESFSKKLQMILNGKIKSLSAKTETKPGWTVLEAVEKYGEKEINISSKDLSDGTLRLLAFLAISEMKDHASVMFLDEIENGINVNYSEQLIDLLRDVTEKKEQQIIVTTHSTAFLDYVQEEEIIYMFRDEMTGYTKAVPLFTLPAFKKRLKNFYPGEIVLNLSNEEILREIMGQE